MTFNILEEAQHMFLHDSGSGNDRLATMHCHEVLDEFGKAKLWLADGAFKGLPSLSLRGITHLSYN
jgi:hypothetical protein